MVKNWSNGLLEYWSNGRDLKGFPKPLRSLKNERSGILE
jgi:hypothetical protein